MMGSDDEGDVAKTPPKKKIKYMCTYLTKWEALYPWIGPVQSNAYKANCSICKREFSIGHGGKNDCVQHMNTAGHKSKANDVTTSSKITTFFSSHHLSKGLTLTKDDVKTIAGELSLVYHTVQHNLSYRSLDCAIKLSRNVFSECSVSKKISCGRTKAEMIIKNVLAPRSVNDFLEVLNDPRKCSMFFSLATDASNHLNRKMFPVVIRYFDPFSGIQNKLLDFVEQADETAVDVHRLLNNSLKSNGLNVSNISSYCADGANINYGKHHSVMKLLSNENEKILKAGCFNHVLHNAMKRACNCLQYVDVEVLVLKIYSHFSCSAKRRQTLKTFFEFVDVEWVEILRHVNTRWLSLTPAVERLLKYWEPIKSYFKSIDDSDCPKLLKKYFCNENIEVETIVQAYISFFVNIGNVFMQKAKYLENSDLSIMESHEAVQLLISKVRQRKEDRFFGSGTHKLLATVLDSNLKSTSEKNFIEFYDSLYSYLVSKFDDSLKCFIPLCLKRELTFNDLHEVLECVKLDCVNEDELYEEFCSSNDAIRCAVSSEGSVSQKWTKVLTSLKSNNVNFQNLGKLIGYVMSIPGSNAHTERVFSLMNNKWTDVRNRSSTNLIKSELQVAMNFPFSCNEFFEFAKNDIKILTEAKSVAKYV